MDPAGFAIHRLAGRASPRLKADLQWRRSRRGGDFAMRVVDALVRPGDVVLDIGAAWGLYANRFAQLVGRAGIFHVFEPNPVYQAPLEALARWLPQLVLHNVALRTTPGKRRFTCPPSARR